ncbi:hypothetical protein [Saccharopolyspora dendranthemae]|uniref:Uncharacterized protein n=1 Tax=Saccharopolyspora dendranthemae TaxID=1181886 RepID=A0A561U5X6_9PSEU|nr:hypothetical protein [Saccharopolyspora dendranthemae]TWF94746.1 hypothetical protein FHU35_13463 [Saccharopolyspora dendranthemae]
MTGRDTEDTLSAALRARASGSPSSSQRARRPNPVPALLFVIVLGLLAGLIAASITIVYPIG